MMRVRLGYACISKTLDGVTSSSNYTYTSFNKDNDFNKLERVIRSNLEDLIEILKYNYKNDIHFYRLSSNIIPLATHNKVMFDYIDKYKEYYDKIAHLVSNMRVDMHTSAYCVLNSVRKEVVDASIDSIKYHYDLLDAMRIIRPCTNLGMCTAFGDMCTSRGFRGQMRYLFKRLDISLTE